MSSRYSGVVLVTNVSSEIGVDVVRSFIEAGCLRIVISDSSLDAIENIQTVIGESRSPDVRIQGVQLDRTTDEGWENMVEAASNVFGGINYCVNCSQLTPALAHSKPTAELDPSIFKAGLNESRELWLCCRAQLRQLLLHPSKAEPRTIVNVIPYGNLGTHPGHAALAASSYGRIGMTKTFAKDYLESGIRVNAVCPALTVGQAEDAPVLHQHIKATGRLVQGAEVANAALFLSGDLASGMSGISLPVDGGWSLVHN